MMSALVAIVVRTSEQASGKNIRQRNHLSLVRLVLTTSTEEEGGNHASDAFNLTRAL